MYPKFVYHHDLEFEVTKSMELEDRHPEWYDNFPEDDDEDQLEFDYDDGDYY